MPTSEERHEGEIMAAEEVNRLQHRIGERVETVAGCPPNTSGSRIEFEETSSRAVKIIIVTPWVDGERRTLLAWPKSKREFDEVIQGLHELLDAHWDTLRMDMADSEGYWTNPIYGDKTKVFDPETRKYLHPFAKAMLAQRDKEGK